MKKSLILFIFFLLAFHSVSAIEFEMKDNFQKGEILLAKVSGNFIEPILKENIYFYRGHVRITIEPQVAKIDDDFYIYAHLPKTENNYSIEINKVRYLDGSDIISGNITRNFLITNSTAPFSTDKGFVFSDKTFYFEVQNLQDKQLTIDITQETISGDDEEFLFASSLSLKSGGIKKINFQLGEITSSTFKKIKLSSGEFSYNIPVYIYNVSTAKPDSTEEGNDLVEGNISETNKTGNESEILENNSEDYTPTTLSTCSELNGTVCDEDESCTGKIEYAQDAPCCLDLCEKNQTSSLGKIIGWAIVIIVAGVLIWFFKFKYKHAKREINLVNIADKGRGKP